MCVCVFPLLERQAMTASKSVINPEAMARLRKDTKFAVSAKKAVNQFSNFGGPPGRYFARLQRLDFRFHKEKGHPCFTFYHTCLAKCPDSGSDSTLIDQTHAGQAMKVFREVKVTEKMTKQDAWDATMVDLQAYGIKTRLFGVRNGVEVQDDGQTFWADLGKALDDLSEARPAVIIDVSEGKAVPGKPVRNFINVRERVDEEVVARFASPVIEVSDDDMEIDEEDDNMVDEGAEPSTEEQKTMLLGLNQEQLIEALESQGLKYNWQFMTLKCIQQVGLDYIDDKPLPPPETFAGPEVCFGWVRKDDGEWFGQYPRSSEIHGSAVPANESSSASDDEEDDTSIGAHDDEEEDDAPAVDQSANLLIKLQNTIANENREQLKSRLRAMGALTPETKFKKEQTDEQLRQWIIDVHTGKVAPAFIVAPTELPPF
jgi:hypothetical protein